MGRISALYAQLGEPHQALSWLKKAGAVFEKAGDEFGLANYYATRAEMHRADGQFDDEIANYRKALSVICETTSIIWARERASTWRLRCASVEHSMKRCSYWTKRRNSARKHGFEKELSSARLAATAVASRTSWNLLGLRRTRLSSCWRACASS